MDFLNKNKLSIAGGLIFLWFIITVYNIRIENAKYWDYLGTPYTPDGQKIYGADPWKLSICEQYPIFAGWFFHNRDTPSFFYMLMTQFGTNVTSTGTLTPYQMFNGIAPPSSEAEQYLSPVNQGYWPSGSDIVGWTAVLNQFGQTVNADTGVAQETGSQWATDSNNFMYQQYGILGTAPMIVKFLNGSDHQSFLDIMGEWGGTASISSGFMGFMENSNQTWGANEAYNYIFGSGPAQNPKGPATCPSGAKVGVFTGLISSMVGPMGAGMVAGPGGSFAGAVIGLGMGLAGAITNPDPCKRL